MGEMMERIARSRLLIRAWAANRSLHRRYDDLEEGRPVLRFAIAMALLSPMICLPNLGGHPFIGIALALYGILVCTSRLFYLTVRLKHDALLTEGGRVGEKG